MKSSSGFIYPSQVALKFRWMRLELCRDVERMDAMKPESARLQLSQQYAALIQHVDDELLRLDNLLMVNVDQAFHVQMPTKSRSCSEITSFSKPGLDVLDRWFQKQPHNFDIYKESHNTAESTRDANSLIRTLSRLDTIVEHERYQKVGRRIRELREHRNDLATIHRLPEYLLEELFCYTTDDFLGSAGNFSLCHVCRLWRTVALQCGRLWSNIVVNRFRDLPVTKVLLSRSNTAFLDVLCSPHEDISPIPAPTDDEDMVVLRPPNVAQLVLAELPRIRSLHLNLTLESLAELAHLIAVHAPRLETLSLSLSADPRDMAFQLLEIPFDFPALRVLNMKGFPAHFSSPLILGALSTITHLQLRVPHEPHGWSLDMETFLTSLQSMTSLATLDLGSRVFLSPLPQRSKADQIIVDRLTLSNLHLSGEISHINCVLRSLQLSPYVNMDIGILARSAIAQSEYTDLGTHLSRILFPTAKSARDGSIPPLGTAGCFWLPNPGLPAVHFMFSDRDDTIGGYFVNSGDNAHQNHVFRDWDQIETVLDHLRGSVPCRTGRVLNLWLINTPAQRLRDERVEAIWSSLPLHEVHTLFLAGVPVDIPEGRPQMRRPLRTFMNYICPMVSVRHLVVQGWEPNFLESLIATGRHRYPDVDWTVPVPFPVLEYLTLVGREEVADLERRKDFNAQLRLVFHSRWQFSLLTTTKPLRELVLNYYTDREGAVSLREWIPQCIRNGETLW